MVVAFLMDTFWKVKKLQGQIKEQMHAQCFVCGESRIALTLLYKNQIDSDRKRIKKSRMDEYEKNIREKRNPFSNIFRGDIDDRKTFSALQQSQAARDAEACILRSHADGGHSLWLWLFFFLWAKDEETNERNKGAKDAFGLHGEARWLLEQICNGNTAIFPLHMKTRSDDIWLTGPFTESTSVDVQIARNSIIQQMEAHEKRIENSIQAVQLELTKLSNKV